MASKPVGQNIHFSNFVMIILRWLFQIDSDDMLSPNINWDRTFLSHYFYGWFPLFNFSHFGTTQVKCKDDCRCYYAYFCYWNQDYEFYHAFCEPHLTKLSTKRISVKFRMFMINFSLSRQPNYWISSKVVKNRWNINL